MTTQTLTPAPSATLTLAKTGLCSGRPALIGYEGKNTVLLVLAEEEGSDWSEIDRSPHGGIRGLGQMMRKLDKDSARNPSEAPAWATETDAPPAFEIPVEERPYLAAVYTGPAPETATETVTEPERVEVVAEVPAAVVSPLAPYLSADVVAEISTTTDLAFLRAAREDAARAGAGHDALRVISMRAGEVVLGFDPSALRKASKPAAAPKVPTVKAPTVKAERVARPEGAPRRERKSSPSLEAKIRAAFELTNNAPIDHATMQKVGLPPSAWTHSFFWSSNANATLRAMGLRVKTSRHTDKTVIVSLRS